MYPAYQARMSRRVSIEERIQGCFERSENGRAPPDGSDVLVALAAYTRWLGGDEPRGVEPSWRGRNHLDEGRRIAVTELRVDQGERIYAARCATCHGVDGQGLGAGASVSPDAIIPPPLWGPRSFNDGAGMARVYTLAGFLRWAMPLGTAGSLS